MGSGSKASRRKPSALSRGVGTPCKLIIRDLVNNVTLAASTSASAAPGSRSMPGVCSCPYGMESSRRAMLPVLSPPWVLRSTCSSRRPAPRASGLYGAAARCVSTTTSRAAASRSSYPAKQPRVPGQQPEDGGGSDAPINRTEAQMRADAAQTAAGADADGAGRRSARC